MPNAKDLLLRIWLDENPAPSERGPEMPKSRTARQTITVDLEPHEAVLLEMCGAGTIAVAHWKGETMNDRRDRSLDSDAGPGFRRIVYAYDEELTCTVSNRGDGQFVIDYCFECEYWGGV